METDLPTELSKAFQEIERLRAWVELADNRLECGDCPQCADVAKSYLQCALEGTPFENPIAKLAK